MTRFRRLMVVTAVIVPVTITGIAVKLQAEPQAAATVTAGSSSSFAAINVADRAGVSATDTLPKRALELMKLDADTVRLVGSFPSVAKQPLRLYTARTLKGESCLVEDGIDGVTPDGRPLRVYGGACSRDLFRGRSVAWIRGTSREADGSERVRFVGLVSPETSRLSAVSASGAPISVPLTDGRAFLWYPPANSAAQPVLLAHQGDGAAIERVTLP